LIKKQGNRKANIKKTKRIRRGGGERNRGKRKGGGGKGLSLLQQVGGWEKTGARNQWEKRGRRGGGRGRGARGKGE
jgi:hypothetical protein